MQRFFSNLLKYNGCTVDVMILTDYHAKYFAHELTKRCSSDSIEKLAGAVASAQVDLNPHQSQSTAICRQNHPQPSSN